MSISVGIGLSNSEGLQLARELIRPQLPHDLHDYVLESICKAVDGIHVLAVDLLFKLISENDQRQG